MARDRGRLFVFEGADGVGKTTLSKGFAQHLESQRQACRHLSFPGHRRGSLGGLVYQLHHDSGSVGVERISPQALQLLHVAAHIEEINEHIRPAIQSGVDVVLDRYWWSTWVYGIVSGLPKRLLRSILRPELDTWAALRPTAVILLDRPPPATPGAASEIRLLRREYEQLAKDESDKYPVIGVTNGGALRETLTEIINHIGCTQQRHSDRWDEAPLLWDKSPRPPTVFSKLSPAKPSPVYDTYWRFATERQQVFFKRVAGEPAPWTDDPILRAFKFTNAYRASDRVSQYLIRNVIYAGDQAPDEVFFRTMLFKLFNKIETWQLLANELGIICWEDYNYDEYNRIFEGARSRGASLYSAAYIMPSGRGVYGYKRKHRTHLKLLECMIKDDLPNRIADARSMGDAFALLRAYPTIGDFLAHQYVTDLNYSTLTDFAEDRFVMAGPGAKDGIRKLFVETGGLKDGDLIKMMLDRQEVEFDRLGLRFQSLWGRRLQLIDCQSLFCEVDKYARVAHPEVKGISGRTRIKQRFRPIAEPLRVWYPPKWGINDKIDAGTKHVSPL